MTRTSSLPFFLGFVFAAAIITLTNGCATTSARACAADQYLSEALGHCVPLALLEEDVPDVPLVAPTGRTPLFDHEWILVVKKDAIVTFDPLAGMVDDDILFEGAFYAGRKAPPPAVAKTAPTPAE